MDGAELMEMRVASNRLLGQWLGKGRAVVV